mgnify:CR=1 FL=1
MVRKASMVVNGFGSVWCVAKVGRFWEKKITFVYQIVEFMSTLQINIEDKLRLEIEAQAKALNLDVETLVKKALSDYFYLRRVDNLRRRLNKKAKALGYKSEEDIFESVS